MRPSRFDVCRYSDLFVVTNKKKGDDLSFTGFKLFGYVSSFLRGLVAAFYNIG